MERDFLFKKQKETKLNHSNENEHCAVLYAYIGCTATAVHQTRKYQQIERKNTQQTCHTKTLTLARKHTHTYVKQR